MVSKRLVAAAFSPPNFRMSQVPKIEANMCKILALGAVLAASAVSSGALAQAEVRACTAYLEGTFNTLTPNKYNPSDVEKTKIDLTFYGVKVNPSFFGGHKYVVVGYFIDTYTNKHFVDRSDSTTGFCVLDGTNQVIGFEDEELE